MGSRITLSDTGMDVLTKMAEGNPGALTAMMEILEKHDQIDPQAMMGGLGAILILDTWDIYGSSIYVLFSDKCNRDVRKMLMLMRATQLGFFPHEKLQAMAADQARQVDLTDEEFNELDRKVCDRLDEFAKPAV
jgi:hypothetical protein